MQQARFLTKLRGKASCLTRSRPRRWGMAPEGKASPGWEGEHSDGSQLDKEV